MNYTQRCFSSTLSSASLLTAGTTATVAMLRDGVELAVASVGDSRALLCRKGRAKKLSRDHTPEREDERQRYGQSADRSRDSSRGSVHLVRNRPSGDVRRKH